MKCAKCGENLIFFNTNKDNAFEGKWYCINKHQVFDMDYTSKPNNSYNDRFPIGEA